MEGITGRLYQINYLTWILSLPASYHRRNVSGDLTNVRLFVDELLYRESGRWRMTMPNTEARMEYALQHYYLTKDTVKVYLTEDKHLSSVPLLDVCPNKSIVNNPSDKDMIEVFQTMMNADGDEDYYLRYIGLNGFVILLSQLNSHRLNEVYKCTIKMIKHLISKCTRKFVDNPKLLKELKWYYSLLPNIKLYQIKLAVISKIKTTFGSARDIADRKRKYLNYHTGQVYKSPVKCQVSKIRLTRPLTIKF